MRKRARQDKSEILYKVSEALNLPSDTFSEQFYIRQNGTREITVEKIHGILDYSQERVELSAKNGIITINGRKLMIGAISEDGIYIRGKVQSIEFTEA